MCKKPFNVAAGNREYIKDKVIETVIEAFEKNDEKDLVIVFKGVVTDLKVGNIVEFWSKEDYDSKTREAMREEILKG